VLRIQGLKSGLKGWGLLFRECRVQVMVLRVLGVPQLRPVSRAVQHLDSDDRDDRPRTRGTSLGGVPREQKMLKGHLT
jgi:hypothetical protein